MSTCQLCGKDTDSTVKAKIEGAVMKVCDSCSEMGEKVQTKSKKSSRNRKKKRRRTSKTEEKVLANNYGKKIREEREDRELTMEELADSMNEKTSVIQKVEQEELKPDRSLASKLSKKLGIDLYVNPQVSDYDDTGDGDTRKATLGDVADIKK
jgi:putative transcription factor